MNHVMELIDELSLALIISRSWRIFDVADMGRVPGWKERKLTAGSFENSSSLTYNEKRQNIFRENISSEHKYEEGVASEDNQSFLGDLFTIKENDDD